MGAGMQGGPRTVALIGFMGAGKSAVGLELAAALGLPFVDTDDLIVDAAGPIEAIFGERGEAGFRELEARVVTGAVADALKRPCVLALGGGAVLSEDVRRALSRLAHVVWLTAPAAVLWERATAEGQAARPLAADRATFEALLGARAPLYEQVATHVAETGEGTPAAVAAGIAAGLSAAAPARARSGGDAG